MGAPRRASALTGFALPPIFGSDRAQVDRSQDGRSKQCGEK